MLLDKQNQFSDAQALTATAASTNVIDLGVAKSISGDMEVNMNVQTELDSAADGATLTVAVQTDTVENFASPTTLVQTAVLAEALLLTGYKLPVLKIPVDKVERYIRLYYTVGVENFTSGNIDANLVLGSDTEQPR